MVILTVDIVLFASPRISASCSARYCADPGVVERISSGFFRVAAGNPAGHGAQVHAGQRGGVEVAAQVVRGFGGPEAGVFDAFLADRAGEGVGAADRDGGVLAAVERVPAERGGDAADALGVEHVHRAAPGADAGGQLEHVVLGGGRHDRPGVVQDDPGQPAGLAARGAG